MRVNDTIEDTLEGTEHGKNFLEKYPEMAIVPRIEGHSRNTGVHAAGVIVCNKPITDYIATGTVSASVNDRLSVLQYDKKISDGKGLLKIDMLGLRTLTILEEVAEMSGFTYHDFYKMKYDDEKVFEIFNNMRLSGIFQFEGEALQMVTSKMGVHSFDDIAAITSLARPGAMNSGGTDLFVQYKTGKKKPVYFSEEHKRITEETYGIVIYQETMMLVVKELAGLSWPVVAAVRRIASKSLGDEAMDEYKNIFFDGCANNGYKESEINDLWKNIASAGAWIFNKAHAVAYAMLSYQTAWCKTYYPLQFVAANLNNAKSPESALRILRDAVKYDGIEYTHIDVDYSMEKWTVAEGKLIGSLTDIDGIGVRKAKEIIKARNGEREWTVSMVKSLENPVTIFSILYPTKYHWNMLKIDY